MSDDDELDVFSNLNKFLNGKHPLTVYTEFTLYNIATLSNCQQIFNKIYLFCFCSYSKPIPKTNGRIRSRTII